MLLVPLQVLWVLRVFFVQPLYFGFLGKFLPCCCLGCTTYGVHHPRPACCWLGGLHYTWVLGEVGAKLQGQE
jgi:hypothetical protein